MVIGGRVPSRGFAPYYRVRTPAPFVFVTPEYNHGPSAALKNAIDFLHREWNNKAVGFVGYGGNGGARSLEILRQVVSNVELADVRAQVGLSLFTDL